MRPLYERAGDLTNERQVADHLGKLYKSEMMKLPIKYGLDYAAVRGSEIRSWIEIKCRKNEMKRYPTYIISLDKILAARRLTQTTALPSILFVRWTDSLGFVNLCNQFSYEKGGRIDRNDWQDVEPVAAIPLENFQLIKWSQNDPQRNP